LLLCEWYQRWLKSWRSKPALNAYPRSKKMSPVLSTLLRKNDAWDGPPFDDIRGAPFNLLGWLLAIYWGRTDVPNLLGGLVKSRYTFLCIILIIFFNDGNLISLISINIWSLIINWSTHQLNFQFKTLVSQLSMQQTARIANEQWASLCNEFLLLRLFGSYYIYLFWYDRFNIFDYCFNNWKQYRITWYEYLEAYYLNFDDVHDCVITFTTVNISCIKGSRANLWSNYRHFIFF